MRFGRLTLVGALLVVGACSDAGGGDDGGAVDGGAVDSGEAEVVRDPRVDLIAPAIDAIGVDQYVEISATSGGVTVLARAPGGATDVVGYLYDGELTGPDEPRPDERATFTADQVELEPDLIFDQLHEQLESATILDLAIHVDSTGLVIDATVESASGGRMLVLLAGDGEILATQAL